MNPATVRGGRGGQGESEPYLTIRAAADRLGLQHWKLQRAVKLGVVPSYTFFNKRRLVLASEVEACICASRASSV